MSGQKTPVVPRLLGYGGLIPFVGLAALSIVEPHHGVMYRGALLLYGAVILSFVGAIHWGVALINAGMNERERNAEYCWSVVPALMGWITCIFSPLGAMLILVVGFVLQFWIDVRSAQRIQWPSWYLVLRTRLTAVASLCLVIGVIYPYA